uniref:Uncharacterized protein n=1 Tax=Laticauda laticaudata TaxID=8630 RepID=A0A8C5RJ21_LATLA
LPDYLVHGSRKFNSALSLKQVDCQDALETAARAEGLPLESSADSHLRALDEEHPKGKYHYGLNLMKPIRTTSKHRHPIDNAGLFSYMTFSWLSPLARLAYKKGELLTQDVWPLSTQESSEVNCRRYGRLLLGAMKLKLLSFACVLHLEDISFQSMLIIIMIMYKIVMC